MVFLCFFSLSLRVCHPLTNFVLYLNVGLWVFGLKLLCLTLIGYDILYEVL
jgi:hypothetical protein